MKVSMQYCKEYNLGILREKTEQILSDLGGWEKFFYPGERVLIKPNLLTKKRPDEAATTHPAVIKALAGFLIEKGMHVTIGDSPGGPFTSRMLNGIYRATGMEEAAKETGASLNRNFAAFTANNPKGLIMKKLTLADMLNDADKVICVAKLKTHAMMTYTGAVKNMFGAVPGVAKAEYHMNMPDYNNFADALIDICLGANPVLSFIDGIVGMEGNGPASGMPVNTGALLASESPYHLDFAACRLIGISFDDVPMLKRLEERGIAGFDEIEFVGEPFEKFQCVPYKRPPITIVSLNNPRIPGFVRSFAARFVQTRPIFDREICNGCGICKESCPVKIIQITNNKAAADYKNCIRCYCCQELCPKKAIGVRRPFLSKILRW